MDEANPFDVEEGWQLVYTIEDIIQHDALPGDATAHQVFVVPPQNISQHITCHIPLHVKIETFSSQHPIK
jgi:hypothetical protein